MRIYVLQIQLMENGWRADIAKRDSLLAKSVFNFRNMQIPDRAVVCALGSSVERSEVPMHVLVK